MSRVDVNTASREELIKIIKQLRAQFSSTQAAAKRTGELEEQVAVQQRELTERNETISALTKQNAKLSEKSASDEETISALIQQLEGRWDQLSPPSGKEAVEGNVLVARTVKSPAVVAKGMKVAAGSVPDIVEGSAASVHRNDEVARLEAKLRELTEINAFYANILSQRGEEERKGDKVQSPVPGAEASQRRSDAEEEHEALQHTARQLTQANAALEAEQQSLREELTRMELELVAAEQWRAAQCNGDGDRAEAPAELPPLFHAEPELPQALSSSPSPVRTLAQTVAPIQYRSSSSHNRKPAVNGRPRNWSVTGSVADTASPTLSLTLPQAENPSRASLWRSILDIGSLQEVLLGNPSRQEKLLSERLDLFQRYVEDMQAQELDRQRSFDEIERTRAELFTSMNERLEAQRREIQQLKRCVSERNAQEPLPTKSTATMSMVAEVTDVACSPIASLAPLAFETNASPAEISEEMCGVRETAGDVPSATCVEERSETGDDDREEQAGTAAEEPQHDNEAELLLHLELPPGGPHPAHDCVSERLEREEECARLRVMSEAADTFACVVGRSALVMSRAAAAAATTTVIADAANRAKEEAAERAEREAKATRSITAALVRHERWEPLRCLSEAYGDIVNAQRALLHSAIKSIPTADSNSDTAAEEKRRVLAALDTALSRSGNEHEKSNSRPSSCAGSKASSEAIRTKGEIVTEAEWVEEKGTKGQETTNGQEQVEIPSWWNTSSAPLLVDAMATGANSVYLNTSRSIDGSANKGKTTIMLSDAIAREPLKEVKEASSFFGGVEPPSGEASVVTADLGMLDFFSTTAFSTANGKPNEEAQSFVAEFDPFA